MEGGFHSVNNVMQSVSLCDTLTVTLKSAGACRVSCNVPNVPCGEDNIACRALMAFGARTGRDIHADIHIEKCIPMAAGLAGGSADAAATLLALNELSGNMLTTEQLCTVGAALGADVPFCITGGCAIGTGKGDILSPFAPLPQCTLVIACGGEGVSTPAAYKLLDGVHDNFRGYAPRSTEELEHAARSGDIRKVAPLLFNIFEEPILSIRPVAKSIREIMTEGGALRAMMSGSGPSVFGIFDSANKASLACEKIHALGAVAHICTPF